MTIGFVIPRFSSLSETFIKSKIKVLESLGHEVTIFTKHTENNYHYKIVPSPTTNELLLTQMIKMLFQYFKLFVKRPKVFFNFLKFEKKDRISFINRWKNLYLNSHILKEDIDWLHFGFSTMSINRENTAISMSIPMSTSIRGYDICVYPLKNLDCYKKLWSKVDKVHSISKNLVEISGINTFDCDIVYNIISPAIDINTFKCSDKKLNSNIKKQKLQFLTIARLNWIKGLEFTLEALALLLSKGVDFHYNIVGAGTEYERLIFAAHQLKLTKHVSFLGAVTHKETRQFYNNYDIYLQYSINEGFCNSVLEAQCMGLITIVSNSGGLTENVIHERTGWVVEKNSPQSLVDTIEHVIKKSNNEIYNVRKNAINHVRENFNLEKQTIEFGKFFS